MKKLSGGEGEPLPEAVVSQLLTWLKPGSKVGATQVVSSEISPDDEGYVRVVFKAPTGNLVVDIGGYYDSGKVWAELSQDMADSDIKVGNVQLTQTYPDKKGQGLQGVQPSTLFAEIKQKLESWASSSLKASGWIPPKAADQVKLAKVVDAVAEIMERLKAAPPGADLKNELEEALHDATLNWYPPLHWDERTSDQRAVARVLRALPRAIQSSGLDAEGKITEALNALIQGGSALCDLPPKTAALRKRASDDAQCVKCLKSKDTEWHVVEDMYWLDGEGYCDRHAPQGSYKPCAQDFPGTEYIAPDGEGFSLTDLKKEIELMEGSPEKYIRGLSKMAPFTKSAARGKLSKGGKVVKTFDQLPEPAALWAEMAPKPPSGPVVARRKVAFEPLVTELHKIVDAATARMEACGATNGVEWKAVKNPHGFTLESGSTSAFESCTVDVKANGSDALVTTEGDSAGFPDFFNHARGGGSSSMSLQEVEEGMDGFVKSWEDSMLRVKRSASQGEPKSEETEGATLSVSEDEPADSNWDLFPKAEITQAVGEANRELPQRFKENLPVSAMQEAFGKANPFADD